MQEGSKLHLMFTAQTANDNEVSLSQEDRRFLDIMKRTAHKNPQEFLGEALPSLTPAAEVAALDTQDPEVRTHVIARVTEANAVLGLDSEEVQSFLQLHVSTASLSQFNSQGEGVQGSRRKPRTQKPVKFKARTVSKSSLISRDSASRIGHD
ncbi:hypothetical protein OS493_039593 [Desmophyllum pertusum]|uniref:Uncharacterized protein n=1 Tax=Desmophyllum pertusum TaxID=174260 RepID=A0A9X0D1R6_9CNID|nr:hypothetical protein OS493_039593 [Desmophyllum pertusum]